MLVSKSFIVVGETRHRNGGHEKDIADKVDAAINSFLEKASGEYVDLKIDVKINPGVGTDIAFVTVILKQERAEKAVSEDEPVIISKKKK